MSIYKLGLKGFFAVLVALGVLGGGEAFAVEPMIDAGWLMSNLGDSKIVVVDIQPEADYLKSHIPGAVNTSFFKSGW